MQYIEAIDEEALVLNTCPLYENERNACISRIAIINTFCITTSLPVTSWNKGRSARRLANPIRFCLHCLGYDEKWWQPSYQRPQKRKTKIKFIDQLQLSMSIGPVGRFISKLFQKHKPFEDKRTKKKPKAKPKSKKIAKNRITRR